MERGRINGIQPFAQLAEGSTATVYKGYQERLDRFVLLKVLRPALARDEDLAQRFEEEARLVAQIQHPNVITIYDYGRTEEQQAYLAAEFVEGTDLQVLLDDHGPLPPLLAAFVLREAAKGLQAAHERCILHRDLKPANVLIATDGHVKLTDFGMASATTEQDDSELRGTPSYLAPEYVNGEPPSEKGDLFALGALLHELLAGHRAFTGEGTGQILEAVCQHDPLPVLDRLARPPAALRDLAERLLAKDPGARCDTASLLNQLNAFLATQPVAPSSSDLVDFMEDSREYREHPSDVNYPAEEDGPDAESPPEHSREAPAASNDDGEKVGQRLARYGLALLLGTVALWAALNSQGGGSERGSTTPGDSADVLVTTPGDSADVLVGQTLRADSISTTVNPLDTLSLDAPSRDTTATETRSNSAQPVSSPASPAGSNRKPEASSPPGASDEASAERAHLQLRVSPWADVYLDGQSEGSTPLDAPLRMAAGVHKLVFKNERFPRAVHKTVHLEAGEQRRLDIVLYKYVGRLTIDIAPWGEVYIDGKYRTSRDRSPQKEVFVLTPGTHTLQLKNPQFSDYSKSFRIKAGSKRHFTFNLNKIETED